MFSTTTFIAVLPVLSFSALPVAPQPDSHAWLLHYAGQIETAQAETAQIESAIKDDISNLLAAGKDYRKARNDTAAVESYQQALLLIRSLERVDPLLEGEALTSLGITYADLREDDKALPILAEALELYDSLIEEEIEPEKAELAYAEVRVDLLRFLGAIHHDRADYATALSYNRPALALAKALRQGRKQAIIQHNIGSTQADIGEYEQAEQALTEVIRLREVAPPGLEASALFTLGWVSERQADFNGAIAHYKSALALYEIALGNPDVATDPTELSQLTGRKVRALNNLGMAYFKQNNLGAARETLGLGLEILTQRDNSRERSILLNSLSSLEQAEGKNSEAWSGYLQALRLTESTDNKFGEIEVLLNFGRLMEAEGQPDLAIFFYKQAIAQIETIRQDLKQLSKDVQQRYALTVEDFYRRLADLLLQQNREAEALQVLELLKLQEVTSYLHSNQADGNEQTFYTASETELLLIFESLSVETTLADFFAIAQTKALISSAKTQSDTAISDPFNLQAIASLKTTLSEQPATTAVLYPLILEDRLEILLLTPAGTVENFTQQISKVELSRTVDRLQKALKDPNVDVKPAAQELYRWLISPIEETLAASDVENIIYLPDGILRYVPLAALYSGEQNGDQWFVEKYQSHNITAATVGDLVRESSSSLSVIAGAFTDSQQLHKVQVGNDTFQYYGLNAAKEELDNLERAVPDTVSLLDGDFTADRMLGSIGNRKILHLATHAQFVPGQPEDSFILFGDGSTVNMREIRDWELPAVDLVVLSACQTASSTEGEGKEILGLGFQVQKTGAGAAIASLWSVDDSATAALMSQFYKALSQGQTKAEALKTAQTALINSNLLSDPHDWAAFILIGNGL